MKFQIHLFVFCLVFVVVGGTGCLADGFYIPSTQAYETLPDIPQQRAFLEFHNGTETLVVESSLDSEEGQRFAWILPLPSPPESIEAVDPGGLSSLQFLTAPRIVTQSEAKIYRPVLALIVSLLITISLVTLNPDVRRQCRDVFISLCFIVFLLMISVGGPFLGDSKSPKSPAEAVSIERIGNYEVAVLSGKDSRAIDDWLRANEYAPLPEKAGRIIDQYIGQGWIFLSSKLLRNETGLLTPHPLKVEFSVDAPVYPIKLTSLVDSGTELLLFVKSLVPYEHPSLHIQFTDKVNITGSKENNNLQVRLEHFERYIWDNGELAGLLEGDGWLSCFRSRLYPGDMKEDLILSKSSLENPYRDMFYTPRGAAAHAVSLVLWIFTIAFPILGISFRLRRKAGKKALLILAVMAVLIALVYGFSLPVNSRIRSFRKYDDSSYRSQLRETIWRINSENYGSEEDFRNAVMQELGKSHRNFYTGDILRIEHSPGNMAFERKNDGGLRIIWYDDSCSKHTLYGF